MPKALSLKKLGPTKSQKPITSFFGGPKSAEIKSSQKPSNVDEVDKVPASPQTSVKRKACSPLAQLSPEPAGTETNLPDGITQDQNGVRSSSINKKQKLLKENGFKSQSPKKEDFKKQDLKTMSKDSPEKLSRSPLTSVDNNHVESENHVKVNHVESELSPKKINHESTAKFENKKCSPRKCNVTPKKNDKGNGEVRRSPRIAKIKAEKESPLKTGSAKISLDFGENIEDDMFGDDWDACDVKEELIEDLDLTSMQRCEVLSVQHKGHSLEIQLKNSENRRGTCYVDGIWVDTPLTTGDIVSVTAPPDSSGRYRVTNGSGLVVLRPDHLVATTSVVGGVFCRRKAVLQERFRGIDSANSAMTIGILVHELVQKALINKINDATSLRKETQRLLKESTDMLYDAGLSVQEASTNMEAYVQPLAEFMQTYVAGKTPPSGKDKWSGLVESVLDIEENVCCPPLGLKGKIDATLRVTIHQRKGKKTTEVPLELKSGRASGSAEHRGQLLLYCMMMGLQTPGKESPESALLLYLKDRVDLREVTGGHPERRDLIMLRNQLVQYLTASPEDIDPENLIDIEEASNVLSQRLPEPISFESACSKCAYLTVCSLHLWHTSGPTVSEDHPLSKLRQQALGHLTTEQVKYFLQWSALLRMEERAQVTSSPLHALWTEDVATRKKRGACAANLKLKSVEPSGDRFLHVFVKPLEDQGAVDKHKGPQEGEFSIVSIENRPWIAAGVVLVAKGNEIHILLERNLSRRLNKDTLYHIDTYESYATTLQNLANLGALMEDSERAQRLRELIIDKSEAVFHKKLSREVGRLGSKLMRSLNIEQQRAVLRALAAKHYVLLQGLPGTGKTQTISVLIQMLVALKQRVLVTAHTHSAVDTVLTRLPESIKVMRLGSSARVSAALQSRCERNMAANCNTPEELATLYDSMEVVGVTCLGAAHAMLARTTFDICIVDEATQVLQSTVLRPLLAATRFVLVGDPEQLPPVVRSRAARRLGMEESLFHRLAPAGTCTLRLQYRMNEALAKLANDVSYGGRLKCANEKVRDAAVGTDVEKIQTLYATKSPWLVSVCSPKPEEAAVFIDMDSMANKQTNSKSLSNANEACVVLAVVDALIQTGVQSTDIGVIAPYREQVGMLRRAVTKRPLLGVEVSTVDQFQGRDKSVILYSCTRSDGDDEKTVKEGEVLNDTRRLAVSVTRAKHKLIVIGHARALKRYTSLQRMINACTRVDLDEDVVTKYAAYVS